MALRLFVLTAASDPLPSVLIQGRKAIIGRAVESEIRLPDPSVSSHHATIRKRGDSYILIDEGSSHGTGVCSKMEADAGGAPVWLAPESPRVLEDGEHVWIGQIELLVKLEATKRGAKTGQEELPYELVRLGLTAAGLEATEELVSKTLRELTGIPDETFDDSEEEPLPDPVGIAALEANDRHPPWLTDLFVSLLAVAILGACAYGFYFLISTR